MTTHNAPNHVHPLAKRMCASYGYAVTSELAVAASLSVGSVAAKHVATARKLTSSLRATRYGSLGAREQDSHCEIAGELASKAWHFANRALDLIEIEQDIAKETNREREYAN